MPEPEKIDPEVLRRLMRGISQLEDHCVIALLGLLIAVRPDVFGEEPVKNRPQAVRSDSPGSWAKP